MFCLVYFFSRSTQVNNQHGYCIHTSRSSPYLQHLRLQKVNTNISLIHELSVVMSMDFLKTVNEVHPSLGDPKSGPSRSISNDTLERLNGVINSLKQEKQERLQKVFG